MQTQQFQFAHHRLDVYRLALEIEATTPATRENNVVFDCAETTRAWDAQAFDPAFTRAETA